MNRSKLICEFWKNPSKRITSFPPFFIVGIVKLNNGLLKGNVMMLSGMKDLIMRGCIQGSFVLIG